MYLLDTDYISILKRQSGDEYERLTTRLAGIPEEDFYISIVSFHEQVQGWHTYLARAKDQAGVTRA